MSPTRNTPFLHTVLLIVVFFATIFTTIPRAFAAEPEIVQVNGKLYRFSHNDSAGVFLVTGKGVILGDPLGEDTATWLQAELDARFGLAVKYVFFSHASTERTKGASVFVDAGAVTVAHQNSITNESRDFSPDIVFNDTLTLLLGGETVELHYPGKTLSDDIIFAYFPAQQAVFTSDFVSVERFPAEDISAGYFPEWFSSIDRMNRLSYIYLLPGSGDIGIKNDAVQHGYYLRELHNRVRRSASAGVTLEDTVNNIRMERYRRWDNYPEQLANNVGDMYRVVTTQTQE